MAFSWTGFGFLLGLLETCSLLVEESDIVVEQVRERCVCRSLIITAKFITISLMLKNKHLGGVGI